MRSLILGFQVIAPWFLSVLFATIAYNALDALGGSAGQAVRILVAAGVFAFGFPFIAAALSIPFCAGIRDSLLPRTLSNNTYFVRRFHSACWVNLYYFVPVYQLVLTLPWLFKNVFRLFGYAGSTEIAIFPDTWIRDLPILKIGKGAYLANKATVGTNLCLANGKILVQTVEIGEKAILGHLAAVGPGAVLGAGSQVGVNCGIGVRTKLGPGADVGLYGFVHHGVSIGAGTTIGAHSFIGLRSKIGDNLVISAGSNIPGGSVLLTQEDVRRHEKGENAELKEVRIAAVTELATGLRSERAATAVDQEKNVGKAT